jgi:hypothetical protein
MGQIKMYLFYEEDIEKVKMEFEKIKKEFGLLSQMESWSERFY